MLKCGTKSRNQDRLAFRLPPECAADTKDFLQRRYRLPAYLREKLDRGLFDELVLGVGVRHRLEEIQLVFVRNGEHPDNDPRIRRETMKLLQRTEKEMQIAVRKLVEILLTNLF